MPIQPSRGELWLANLSPTVGHEQAGSRPVLVLSTNRFNHGPAELAIIAPLTRTFRNIPSHIRVDPPEGGLRERSYILCEAVRSLSTDRFGSAPLGSVSDTTMAQVEDALKILLELF